MALELQRLHLQSLEPKGTGRQSGARAADVRELWHHGFTENFNNAIDHSEGARIGVFLSERTPTRTRMSINDDGIGFFYKIRERFGLEDQRHAILELAKGKLTTDPANHSGEGIFFTPRMMDDCAILSGDVYFSRKLGEPEDWIVERSKADERGTFVGMNLKLIPRETERAIFDQYASPDNGEYGSPKTVVPVRVGEVWR